MDFQWNDEEVAFRAEVHAFLSERVTLSLLEETESGLELGPQVRAVLQDMGAKGWLAPGWPVEFGGLGASPAFTAITEDELAYFRVLPAGRLVGIGIVGPVLMRFGSKEQQARFLHPIAHAEVEFCLAYTESGAGSDLAALQTKAWRDGDNFVIEGEKIFNTRAHYSQHHWLVARTDPEAERHRGISLFIVDSSSPGITVTPWRCLSGKRTNVVHYDRVVVPASGLVGEENRGWEYLSSAALTFERVFPVGDIRREFEDLAAYLRSHPERNGSVARQKLGELAVRIGVAELLSHRVTWLQSKGIAPSYECDALKVFTTELWQQLAAVAVSVIGLPATLSSDSIPSSPASRFGYDYLDTVWRTIAGGASEVMRSTIAARGLGLPRG